MKDLKTNNKNFRRFKDARLLALDWIDKVLNPKDKLVPNLVEENKINQKVNSMFNEDKALFKELSLGVAREKNFLDSIISSLGHAKMPKSKTKNLIYLGAYQILFLDKIPEYAVFSETKRLSRILKLNESEFKFIHGVLKKIQERKDEFLRHRKESLVFLSQGEVPRNDFDFSVLGAPEQLYQALCFTDEKVTDPKKASQRAIKALLKMKDPHRLVGFVIYGMRPHGEYEVLKSELAPFAVKLNAKAIQTDSSVRVQSESSQVVSMLTAKTLIEKIEKATVIKQSEQNTQVLKRKKIKVLEMCAGKGTKFLASLSFLSRLRGALKLSQVEWVLCDASQYQLDFLKNDVLPIVKSTWPELQVEVVHTDFSDIEKHLVLQNQKFDLVLLDSPCSGFGSISKKPQILHTKALHAKEVIKANSEIQRKLLEVALQFTTNESNLIYSVCTLTYDETYGQLEFLKEKFGIKPLQTFSFWPGLEPLPQSEGFFIAKF